MPCTPSEPNRPSWPSGPTDPSRPSGPTDPSRPSGPTDPSRPSGPIDLSEPTLPGDAMVTKEKHYSEEACCSRETSRPSRASVLTSWPCRTSDDPSPSFPNNYIDTSPHSDTPDADSPILSEAFSQPVRPHAESTLNITKQWLPSKDDSKPVPTARNSLSPEMATPPHSPPVHARLVAGGISVTYRAPAPPLITPADVPILHYDHEEEEDGDDGDGAALGRDAELAAFLARVKSASPLATRRSDTSSASLPVSPWLSSRDSLLLALSSPGGGGGAVDSDGDEDEDDVRPASLTSEDFEPQIMTEDCAVAVLAGVSVTSSPSRLRSSSTDSVASSTRTAGSSASSGGHVYYSSYIPDREVVIVENEFTRFQPAPPVLPGSVRSSTDSEVRDSHDEDKISLGYDTLEDGGGGKRQQEYYSRAWHYNSAAEMKAFWEARAGQVLIKASSESNIFEHGRQPPENGLREIPRDREYTSGEEEEEEEEYQADELRRSFLNQPYEESGFYSYGYDNVIPEEPSDFEDSWTSDTARHISLIAVGHQHNSPHSLIHIEESEEEGDLVVGQSSDENDHVTVISVEPPPPVAASTNNRCRTAAVLTPTTNTTNNTPHRRVNTWGTHAINNSGTAVDEERRQQLSSPPPPFRCSVKDLRRMFERQAATAATFEPSASTSGGRSRGSSVPDGTVMSLSLCKVVFFPGCSVSV